MKWKGMSWTISSRPARKRFALWMMTAPLRFPAELHRASVMWVRYAGQASGFYAGGHIKNCLGKLEAGREILAGLRPGLEKIAEEGGSLADLNRIDRVLEEIECARERIQTLPDGGWRPAFETITQRGYVPGDQAAWRTGGGGVKAQKKMFEIDGGNFSTLEVFYEEISRVLLPGVDWGNNLDALDDVLSGGFGTPENGFVVRWNNSEVFRERLGYPETVRQLGKRLEKCHPSNRKNVIAELEKAKKGQGQTVFDWLVEIFESHGEGGMSRRAPSN